MALVLVRLKLALQRRALGGSGIAQRIGFALGWLVALVLGFSVGAVVAEFSARLPAPGDLALLIVLSLVFVGWVVTPILMPGSADQMADPERLALYPLTPRQQVTGLLLAGLLAPTALFAFLTALGGAFTADATVGVRLTVVGCAVVFTVLCLTASRATQALLGGIANSRRGRDLVVLVTGVIGLGIYLLTQDIHRLTESLAAMQQPSAESALSWLPPGAVGQAMISAQNGQWGDVAVRMAVAIACVGLLLLLWAWGIRRFANSGHGGFRHSTAKTRSSVAMSLTPFPVNAARPSVLTAAMSQQLRYYLFRSPRAFQSMALSLVLAGFVGHNMSSYGLVAESAAFALMAIALHAPNLFAYDDKGFTYLLITGGPWRPVLIGKALAGPLIVIPVMFAVLFVEAGLADGWSQLLVAVVVGVSVVAVAVGLGAFVSIWEPQNRIERTGGRRRALLGLAVEFVLLFAIMFAGVLAWLLLGGRVSATLLILACLIISVLLGWVLVRAAGSRLARDPFRIEALLRP